MTNEQFDNYLDECYEKLESKQQKFLESYEIDRFDEYWYDQEHGILQFKIDNQVKLEFNVVFIGSWSSLSNSWMWSWANESMIDSARSESVFLKGLQNKTGSEVFANPFFECDEEMAYELTAFAVDYSNAIGMYMSPDESSSLFMAVISPRTV